MADGKALLKDVKTKAKQQKKEENIMKNTSRKETFKTWTIIVLVTAIICAGAYIIGRRDGYNDRANISAQVNNEVTKQVSLLKPNEQK